MNANGDKATLSQRAVALLVQHHQRTRDERKSLIQLVMGFCGSAIVLSVAFLEDLAPSRLAGSMIFIAWSLFGLSLLVGLLTLLRMLGASIAFQRSQRRKATADPVQFEREPWPTSASLEQMLGADGVMVVLAVLGAVALGVFAVINLWR